MSDRGVRDLYWIIDTIQRDYREDDDDVNGSWRIVRRDTSVYVLFEPYDDGSAEFVYPPKATAYVLVPSDVVEGDDAKQVFENWTSFTNTEEA